MNQSPSILEPNPWRRFRIQRSFEMDGLKVCGQLISRLDQGGTPIWKNESNETYRGSTVGYE